MKDGRYNVRFNDANGLEQTYTYDKDGQVYNQRSEVSDDEVLSPISDYYEENYNNEDYTVYRERDKTGKQSYYIDRDGQRLYFNDHGEFQKRAKSPDDNMGSHKGTDSDMSYPKR